MQFSQFAQKYLGNCGILQLMDDLGKYANADGMIMLGGGNPSLIPEVEEAFRHRMGRILDSNNELEQLIGTYDGPNGNAAFVDALVHFFREEYGWQITANNIALTNGSQTAFFSLFNMFAGAFPNGTHKKILLPLCPEYIGYEDVGLIDDLFVSHKPTIQFLDDGFYKYHVDFDALTIDETIGAICVSRPTNPTGNVLTEAEIEQLSQLAQQHNIPLIIDNAYGLPFPSIIITEAQPTREPHIVMCMSLSKLGLPGARTGIIIAHEQIIQGLSGITAVMSLAPGSFGPSLAIESVTSRDILRLSKEVIKPHYEQKARQAVSWLREALADTPTRIHKPEGAIFLWLWFEGLPITSQALYERLKARGVLIIPGQNFFPGLAEEWPHKYECIRLNYAGDPEKVKQGVEIIAEVVPVVYQLAKTKA